MKNKKISVKALLAGSVIAGSLNVSSVNAAELMNYSNLGSGASLRSALLNEEADGAGSIEAKCGADTTKTAKTKDHKCGEGKCGEKKKEGAAKDSKDTKAKSKDHKCGEGKCGEKKH